MRPVLGTQVLKSTRYSIVLKSIQKYLVLKSTWYSKVLGWYSKVEYQVHLSTKYRSHLYSPYFSTQKYSGTQSVLNTRDSRSSRITVMIYV